MSIKYKKERKKERERERERGRERREFRIGPIVSIGMVVLPFFFLSLSLSLHDATRARARARSLLPSFFFFSFLSFFFFFFFLFFSSLRCIRSRASHRLRISLCSNFFSSSSLLLLLFNGIRVTNFFNSQVSNATFVFDFDLHFCTSSIGLLVQHSFVILFDIGTFSFTCA